MKLFVSEFDFMIKKSAAFVLPIAVLLAFSACSTKTVTESTTTFTEQTIETTQAISAQESTTAEVFPEAETVVTTTEIQTTTEVQTTEAATTEAAVTTTEMQTTEAIDDTSSWDVQKIVSFYKDAATATGSSVKSQQTVGLKDISVNNGQLGGIFSFVTPILSSFLSSSVTETDGITGDFIKLTAEDISSAKAYKCSKGTAVEITLNPQSDNASADVKDGSVAHGISVVGDLPSIMSQLGEKGLPIDISMENTVLSYTEPVIKAVIDENGNITNGTWSCTVEISLSDYKFAGSPVDSTIVVLDNKITTNGGFNP